MSGERITEGQDLQPTFNSVQKAIISLVGDLRTLKEFSQKLNLDQSIPLINDVIERAENKSFSVAVVGEFNRGKSTFINALLGKDILPSDILPCSATLNRITYGVTPGVKVIFKDGREEDVGINKLEEYVTKLTEESEDRAYSVKEAVVFYPVPYCQNNVDIIDTPGLNDESNMDQVTLSVLPQVDTAIMIILAQAPFAESERKFLKEKLLTEDLGKIIFVVNGIDNFNNSEDADKVIKSIQNRIQKMIIDRAKEDYGDDSSEYNLALNKIGTPKVFGLSAYQALKAKESNDSQLLIESRFAEFEASLERFLANERGSTFLQVPINRIIASSTEILSNLNKRENSIEMDLENFQKKYNKSVEEITILRERSAAEMQNIDSAALSIQQEVRPIISQFPKVLRQAAIDAIDTAVIEPSELKDKKNVGDKLGQKISESVYREAQKQSDKIQKQIEIGLVKEVSRLENFAQDVLGTLQKIELEFGSIDASSQASTNATGEGITAALAVFTGFGGIWSGYKEAGIKGAAVGAAGSFGTFVAAGLVAGIIGLPVTFPVIVVVGVLSVFTGGKLVKSVFGAEQVQNFKKNYKEAALKEIDNRLSDARIEQNINHQISDTFDRLKSTVRQEVNALLDNTQRTLEDINAEKVRGAAVSEQKRQEILQMRQQTNSILEKAQVLSEQLTQKIDLASQLVNQS